MHPSLRKVFYRIVKPRSTLLSNFNSPLPSDRCRIVDAENGTHRDVSYRLESVVVEERNRWSVDAISKSDIRRTISRAGYNVGANLALMEDLREERRKDHFSLVVDWLGRLPVLDHVLTRPSYSGINTTLTSLILTGLALPDLEEVRVAEAEKNIHDLFHPMYTGTPYEIYVAALGGKFTMVDGKAVPTLSVDNYLRLGHIIAQEAIDFALSDEGEMVLKDKLSPLKCKRIWLNRVTQANADRIHYFVNHHLTSDLYIGLSVTRQLTTDVELAPVDGTHSREEMERRLPQLIPDMLQLYVDSVEMQETTGGLRGVLAFNDIHYPVHGERIFYYPSRKALQQEHERTSGQIRVLANARNELSNKMKVRLNGEHYHDVSSRFEDLLVNLYKTDRLRWFEYFQVPPEKWHIYGD